MPGVAEVGKICSEGKLTKVKKTPYGGDGKGKRDWWWGGGTGNAPGQE